MSIRSAVKAVIIDEGKLLLTKCDDPVRGIYYELPGGGQEKFETMREALVRECLEETGYTVEVGRFLAFFEEIFTHPELEARYSEYVHRIYHFFLCRLASREQVEAAEADSTQIGLEWFPLEGVAALPMHPKPLRERLMELLAVESPGNLGSERIASSKHTLN